MHERRQRGAGGAVAPLDIHTWYKYSRERLKSAMFRCFSAIFVAPPPWKRLNRAIFQTFLLFFGPFSVPPLPEIFLPTPLILCTLSLFLFTEKYFPLLNYGFLNIVTAGKSKILILPKSK